MIVKDNNVENLILTPLNEKKILEDIFNTYSLTHLEFSSNTDMLKYLNVIRNKIKKVAKKNRKSAHIDELNTYHLNELHKLSKKFGFKSFDLLSTYFKDIENYLHELETDSKKKKCLNRSYDVIHNEYYAFNATLMMNDREDREYDERPIKTAAVYMQSQWESFDKVSGEEIRGPRVINISDNDPYFKALKDLNYDVLFLNNLQEIMLWLNRWRGYAMIPKTLAIESAEIIPTFSRLGIK